MPTENASPALIAADTTRSARAAFVRDTLKNERWSIRQAALALGMSHTALASRLRSETAFLADEIEGIAALVRHEPVDYFRLYLEAGTKKAPTPEGEGLVHPLGLEPRTHWFSDNVVRGRFGEGGTGSTEDAPESPLGQEARVVNIATRRGGQVA